MLEMLNMLRQEEIVRGGGRGAVLMAAKHGAEMTMSPKTKDMVA